MFGRWTLWVMLGIFFSCGTYLGAKEPAVPKPANEARTKLSPETIESVKKEIRAFYDELERLWNAHDLEGYIKYTIWNSPDYTDTNEGKTVRGYEANAEAYRKDYSKSLEKMGHAELRQLDIDVIRSDEVQAHVKATIQRRDRELYINEGFERLKKFADGWKIVSSDYSPVGRFQIEKMETGTSKSRNAGDVPPSDSKLSPSVIEAVKKEIRDFYQDTIKTWNTHDWEGYVKRTIWNSPNYIEIADGVTYHGYDEVFSTYRKDFLNKPEAMPHIELLTLDVDVFRQDYVRTYAKAMTRLPFGDARVTDGFETLQKFSDGWKTVISDDSSLSRKQIADLYAKMMKQWNANDMQAYFSCGYWNSDNFVYIEDGVVTSGWKQALAVYQRAFPDQKTMGTLDIDIIDVRLITPDTASVFVRTTIHPVGRGVIPSDTFDTLKKFSDGWKIVSNQDVSTAP